MAAAAPAAVALAVGIYGPNKRNRQPGERTIQRSNSVVRREAELIELQASLESSRMLPCLGEMDPLAQRTVRAPVLQYVPLTYRAYEIAKDPTIIARIKEDAYCALMDRINQIHESSMAKLNFLCGLGGIVYYRMLHSAQIRKLALFLDENVNPVTRPAGVLFRLEVDEEISFLPVVITMDILSEHNGTVVSDQLIENIAHSRVPRRIASNAVTTVEMQ